MPKSWVDKQLLLNWRIPLNSTPQLSADDWLHVFSQAAETATDPSRCWDICQLAHKLINIFGLITESSFSDDRICCCSFVDIIVNVLYFPFRVVDWSNGDLGTYLWFWKRVIDWLFSYFLQDEQEIRWSKYQPKSVLESKQSLIKVIIVCS